MPKGGRQVKTKRSRRPTKPKTLAAYIAAQYRATPGLRAEVTAMVREMLREQDAAATRRGRPTGPRKRGKVARRRKARSG